MANEFKLALQEDGEAGLTLLTALTTPITSCVPIPSHQVAQETERLGDGSLSEQGGESFDWLFADLTVAEYKQIKAFKDWVYVRHPNDEDDWHNYLAYMSLPIEPPRVRGGHIYGLTAHFGMAEEQEEGLS